MTPWEALGPDEAARRRRLDAVVEDFYRRVVPDPMIGFMFRPEDAPRLARLEADFTAAVLGGPKAYAGRGMRAAHAASPILGGHFDRRQQLLREVFEDHELPNSVREAWLAHNETLRPKVVRSACGVFP